MPPGKSPGEVLESGSRSDRLAAIPGLDCPLFAAALPVVRCAFAGERVTDYVVKDTRWVIDTAASGQLQRELWRPLFSPTTLAQETSSHDWARYITVAIWSRIVNRIYEGFGFGLLDRRWGVFEVPFGRKNRLFRKFTSLTVVDIPIGQPYSWFSAWKFKR